MVVQPEVPRFDRLLERAKASRHASVQRVEASLERANPRAEILAKLRCIQSVSLSSVKQLDRVPQRELLRFRLHVGS